jgi:hypothetical protein
VSKQELQYGKEGKYFTVLFIMENLLIRDNKTVFYVSFSTHLSCSEEEDPFLRKYLRVNCGEMLEVGEVIKYRCEIGNLGEMTSTITGIVMEDENVLKLDDHGFVRYHAF